MILDDVNLEFYWNGSTIAYNGHEELLSVNILSLLHNEDFIRILRIARNTIHDVDILFL